MIVLKQEEGFAVLHGRNENEWIIAPWWPCSGAAIRKIAPNKLPKEFVDECARFADAIFTDSAHPATCNATTNIERKMATKSANKIISALRDAVAGKIGRATVFREGAPIQQYTICSGCSGLTLTDNGKCSSCGDSKIKLQEPDKTAEGE